jgi:hypothetical protein
VTTRSGRHPETLNRFFDWLCGRIPCLRQRVLVNLIDGETAVRGVLWAHRGGFLVLKDAQLVTAKQAPVAMDGDVVIECAKVLFTQVAS